MTIIKKIRTWWQSLFTLNNGVLALALFITASWAWGTVEAIQRNFILQQQVDLLQQEVALAEIQNKTLEIQRAYYQTPEFLELSARKDLNKAAPGEKLVILPPHKTLPASSVATQAPVKNIKDRSNLEQWMYFLFANKG